MLQLMYVDEIGHAHLCVCERRRSDATAHPSLWIQLYFSPGRVLGDVQYWEKDHHHLKK